MKQCKENPKVNSNWRFDYDYLLESKKFQVFSFVVNKNILTCAMKNIDTIIKEVIKDII